MAVKLRMQRTGRKNHAQYRVVAADTRSPRDGKCIEILGWYDPHGSSGTFEKVNLERVNHWVSVGAQMSPSVKQIVKRYGKQVAAQA